MKRKIMFIVTALLCMVTANATDMTVTLSSGTIGGSATWTNDGSGNYTFTGTAKTDYVEFSLGDISGYYDLVFNIVSASSSGKPGIQIVNVNDNDKVLNDKTWGNTSSPKTYYLQYNSANSVNSLRISNSKLANIKLRICGQGAASTFVFSSIVLHGATMSCLPGTPIGNLTYYKSGSASTPTNLSNSSISSSGATIYGYYAGSPSNYADVSGYDAVNVVVKSITSGTPTLRFLGYSGSSDTKFDKTLDAISTAQTVTFSLSDYKSAENIKLNFIKTTTSAEFELGDIYLTKANDPIKYYISGQKIILSTALTAAKADASCTAVDVSGVTSFADPSATSMLDLDPADFTNKNCLFVAPSAATGLTQNNVIVGTACANLSLVDGSAFNAPSAFTATNATYVVNTTSRDMTTTAGTRYGTIILPFATSGNTTYKFFTITSASTSQLVLAETSFTKADKPYIFRLNANAGESASLADITASSASVAATPSSLAQDAVNGTALTGSYTAQTLSTTDAYYLGTGDKFYKSTGTLTVNPFRAYFNGTPSSDAKSLSIGENDGDVTAINEALGSTPLIVTAGTGVISFIANKAVSFNVYNDCGMLVKKVSLNSSDNSTMNVPSGIYIVNGVKVYVK